METTMTVAGGRLCFSGSKWRLELYLHGWRPEVARLFRATRIEGLTGEETRIRMEGIRPLIEFEVLPKPSGTAK